MDTPPRPVGWPRTEAEALAVQAELRLRVDEADRSPVPGAPGTVVAGLDVAYDDGRDLVAAAAVALDAHSLDVLARATAFGRIAFPYVPGLLAFREIPALLEALDALREQSGRGPDLLVCDGYGRAHPRRFGLASHLGVLTGVPAMGVAKNPFLFTGAEPGPRRGDSSPLLDGTEEVGSALRTQDGVKPVYVSSGHRVSLQAARAHTLSLARRYRLPETTRRADALCRAALREALREAPAGETAYGGKQP